MSAEKRPAPDSEEEPTYKRPNVEDEVQTRHQKAMQLAASLSAIIGCQVDVCVLPTSDFWHKLVENFIKKNRPDLTLTISSQKSFYHFVGRLLASYIYAESDLDCHFNALGAYIWIHHWADDLRCYHGLNMVSKPITYNLMPNSEEGIRALSSGEGKLEKGKNQKDIVKLTNYGNIVCPEDLNVQWPVIHSPTSCGVNFGNKDKAKAAHQHNIEWTAAMFPNAKKAEIAEKMIIITKCFCNYGFEAPQLGRQICKMTAFEIPGAVDLDPETTDPMLAATQKYRYTYVYSSTCKFYQLQKSTKN
ncbi:DNA-binding protein [Raptor adenovirus 1]|uniref:DNA-binding protein n=1 Tax=Raptor adenovirus 1 TaxID=1520002 RepID=F4MI04_9ADEN|nr:DBP [Raptor adenovirus 1]AEC32099.1 DNA-binding protein [Raptor adenovirus 1]